VCPESFSHKQQEFVEKFADKNIYDLPKVKNKSEIILEELQKKVSSHDSLLTDIYNFIEHDKRLLILNPEEVLE
jgi:hypothetical protein